MSMFKKLYKEYFGIINETEETTKLPTDPAQLALYNKELEKTSEIMKSMSEADLDEAQLVNNLTDYRGGVEYVLRDPSQAKDVAAQIQEWTTKKGFTVVKHTISKSGKIGYFYFRLGEDPEREAQRIQGYFSSKIEIKFFRFNVRNAAAPKRTIEPQQEF